MKARSDLRDALLVQLPCLGHQELISMEFFFKQLFTMFVKSDVSCYPIFFFNKIYLNG